MKEKYTGLGTIYIDEKPDNFTGVLMYGDDRPKTARVYIPARDIRLLKPAESETMFTAKESSVKRYADFFYDVLDVLSNYKFHYVVYKNDEVIGDIELKYDSEYSKKNAMLLLFLVHSVKKYDKLKVITLAKTVFEKIYADATEKYDKEFLKSALLVPEMDNPKNIFKDLKPGIDVKMHAERISQVYPMFYNENDKKASILLTNFFTIFTGYPVIIDNQLWMLDENNTVHKVSKVHAEKRELTLISWEDLLKEQYRE